MAADVELIDDAPQIGVGLDGHVKDLPIQNYFSVLLLFSTEVLEKPYVLAVKGQEISQLGRER